MKKEYTTSQWLLHKVALMFTSVTSSYIVYDIIYGGTLYEIRSLINHGDIINIYRQSIAVLSSIPIFIHVIFFSISTLFKKGIAPTKKLSRLGLIWAIFSTIIFIFGFIASFLIPFGLIFSSYSNCNEERLSSYYVTNLELCKTIDPRHPVYK